MRTYDMPGLIDHIVRISARIDRTEINGALLAALTSLFKPRQVTIYRYFGAIKDCKVFACASHGPGGSKISNAYLPDHRLCFPISRDALLDRCRREHSAVYEAADDGWHRIVFPILQLEGPTHLVDLILPDHLPADQRANLTGLIEYTQNHLALLDYGETDTLTGLANRKTFEKHLFELLGKASRDPEPSPGATGHHPLRRRGTDDSPHWLAVCDIDHFKRINDEFGHLIGDEVLIMLSQVMRRSFRFDDQLFRFGGEEFVALLQPADIEAALATLERFRENVKIAEFSRAGHITVSVGFTRLAANDTPTDAIDRADEALYFAKQHGRNQVACYETLIKEGRLTTKVVSKGEIELF